VRIDALRGDAAATTYSVLYGTGDIMKQINGLEQTGCYTTVEKKHRYKSQGEYINELIQYCKMALLIPVFVNGGFTYQTLASGIADDSVSSDAYHGWELTNDPDNVGAYLVLVNGNNTTYSDGLSIPTEYPQFFGIRYHDNMIGNGGEVILSQTILFNDIGYYVLRFYAYPSSLGYVSTNTFSVKMDDEYELNPTSLTAGVVSNIEITIHITIGGNHTFQIITNAPNRDESTIFFSGFRFSAPSS
jgi:hypothetical protein